jgi:hypothetical protein
MMNNPTAFYGNCRSCKERVLMIKTVNQKWIPVNLTSLSADDIGRVIDGSPMEYEHGRHIAHFATCPEAKKWRKREKVHPFTRPVN